MIPFILFLLLIVFSIYLPFPKAKSDVIPPYEAILILGYPTNENGTLSMRQQERCDKAITLIQKGYADTIIISGGCVKNDYAEATTMENYILSRIPNIKILKEEKACSTFQNLQYTKALYPFERILIVTSPAHIRRSWFFTKKFYEQADIIACKKYDALQFYLIEYIRLWVCLYYEMKLKNQKR